LGFEKKMAVKKKATTTKAAKSAAKKPAKKAATKKAVAKAPKSEKTAAPDLKDLDRKALAARARQIKTELLAIRFNVQAPSLKDYRKKKKELASVLAQLA
jgi:ribosomal protein L29